MRLTLQQHQVRSVRWGTTTRLRDGELEVDQAGLVAELLTDPRLAGVDLELAEPGEACRIFPVFDVVEPRAKLDPAGVDFPGVLSPVASAGQGTTRVLRGLAVTTLDAALGRGSILDLFAPVLGQSATAVSRYANLRHLVVVPRLAEGVAGDQVRNTLRLAALRAAVYLARTVDVSEPGDASVLELAPVAEDLPRIAYVLQLHSHQVPTVPGEPVLYGDNVRHLLPTIIHPNEVLDGALVRPYGGMLMETYGIQNNATVQELYGRHGREINFVGVVVYVANQLAEERERATVMASNLVKWTLKADGAVFTKSGGGAPHVDMALIAERCESLGVRTVLSAWHSGDDDPQDTALFNAASLDAIVSLGSFGFNIELPRAERVIAPTPALAESVRGPLGAAPSRLLGVMDHLGSNRLTALAV